MSWFLLAFLSALFSAASAVSEKKALFKISALDFSYLVSFVTLVLSIPFFIAADYANVNTITLTILFVKTLLSAAAYLCVMLAIKNLEISEALPLLALSPGIVAILAFILIGDWLNIYEWTGIFLMVAGTYVLELNKHSGNLFYPFKKVFHFSKFSYVHTALLLFAVTSLLDRLLLKQFNLPPMTFMAFQQLFYVFFFAAAVLIERKSLVEPFKKNPRDVISLILLISLFTIVYRYTQIEAIKLAPVALVLSVKRLSVLMAVVWGGNLFGENNLIKRFFATVVILAGAVILLNQ